MLEPLRPIADAVVARLPDLAPSSEVVDLACGPGEPGLTVLDRFPQARLTGVDNSPDMLAIARQRAQDRPNARFVHSDIEHLDLPDDSADAVVSRLGLLSLGDVGRSAREFVRIARPGAAFSVAVWDRNEGNTMTYVAQRSLLGLVDESLLPPLASYDIAAEQGLHVAALNDVGVSHVETELFTWTTRIEGFAPLWSMLTQPGMWSKAVATLDDAGMAELRRRYAQRLAQYTSGPDAYVIPTTCRLIWGRV